MESKQILWGALALTLAALTAGMASAELVAVSQMGYHPDAHKRVVSYTGAGSGTAFIKDSGGNTVATFALTRPTDAHGNTVSCQGGQSCLVADFSGFRTAGTYHITTSHGGTSPTFTITDDIYRQTAPTLLEFFEAARQQDSSYHEDLHRGMDPAFTIMADGSFIMEAYQAADTLIRLGSAYRINPGLFTSDRYTITASGQPDMREHIRMYVEYLEGLQDHDGTPAVPKGWNNNFQCAWDVRPDQEKWNENDPDPCMTFHAETHPDHTAPTLLSYAQAIPALEDLDGAKAQQVLGRAIETYHHLHGQSLSAENKGYFGAAAFLLYDYTQDAQYLRTAHEQRHGVSENLDAGITRGNEFYWEEYARHKDAILAQGWEYAVGGKDPAQFFADKVRYDYADRWKDPISDNGELVYAFNLDDHNFQQARMMLIEGLFASKAEMASGDTVFPVVADAQLAWLTGQNSVQDGDGAGPTGSLSFVFGIGDNPDEYHSRLVPWHLWDSMTFLNGKKIIPGWISGPIDSFNDGDSIYNHYDNWNSWQYTETTNEMVAAALELIAYRDARYNGAGPATPPVIDPTDPGTGDGGGDGTVDDGNGDGSGDTGGTGGDGSCAASVADVPVTCSGTVRQDTYNGCRSVICDDADGSITVLACDKPDGATPERFELYKQASSGAGAEVCLGGTCLSDGGFASGDLPYCAADDDGTTGGDSDGTGGTGDDGTGGDAGSGDACHSALADMPVTCEGGSITSDSFNGCRTVACAGEGQSLTVLACEKPNTGTKEYFELYKQQSTANPPTICIGDTCLSDSGYARSGQYPICTEGSGGTDGGTAPTDGGTDGTGGETAGSLSVTVKDWFPQGKDYVFICDGAAGPYGWAFGDGHHQTTTADDVWHTYSASGAHTVTCSASGQTGSLTVDVQ